MQNEAYMREVTEKYQETVVKLNSLCRVYSQADRVITGDPVNVIVVDDGPAPAWSDGKDIFINRSEINDFDVDEIVGINGLNYHELAHHLFSPRRATTLVDKILRLCQQKGTQKYMFAFNALEDQRIETLLVGKYPSVAPYLTHTVARWLASTPESLSTNYICIRGRTYLPLDLRIAFRDSFAYPQLIPVIADIVDQYRVLVFARDYDKAYDLIVRFAEEVLDKLPNSNQPNAGGPNTCGARAPVKSGKPDPQALQKAAAERGAGIGKKEPTFTPPESDDASNTNNEQPSEPEQPSFVIPSSPEEALAMREAAKQKREGNTPQGRAPGDVHVQSVGGLPDNIKDMLKEISEDIISDKEVMRDVKAKQRAILGNDKHTETVGKSNHSNVDAPLNVVQMARRFSRELERIKEACEPTWLRETPAGRVNVQRVIRGCDIDEAFDQWTEGQDATNMEVVILIDRSGSMSSGENDLRASEACWIIKRSMDMIDIPTTVYSFDTVGEVVYDSNTRAEKTSIPFLYGRGGTNPETTLISAERLLMSSKKRSKLLFLITDGEFNHNPNDEIIARLNSRGITTVLMVIAGENSSVNDVVAKYNEYQHNTDPNTNNGDTAALWHKAKIYGIVHKAADVFPFARQIVLDVIKSNTRR